MHKYYAKGTMTDEREVLIADVKLSLERAEIW